ncbi:MAG: hypothetical protein IKF93_10575, partial [Lachnospiraceae bacterium]|nr:hypothetical protein [Lachnospiraceae bacterium]
HKRQRHMNKTKPEFRINFKNPRETFHPGDKITIYGWQDGKNGIMDSGLIERQATVIKAYPKFLHVRYKNGLEGTWNYWNLKYALNKKIVPDYYYSRAQPKEAI